MDYKGPNEYRQEQKAFYRGIGIEALWIIATALFASVCIYAGYSNQGKSYARPVSTDRITTDR